MDHQLIVVKQLPIIEQRLKEISVEIDKKVDMVTALAVTEDTVTEVKKMRASLNKELEELEEKRKEVKSAILSPYEQFEKIYKENVSYKYRAADSLLKDRINEVENRLKEKRTEELKEYFDEYAAFAHVDFLSFIQLGINVTLSSSMKSLKNQVKEALDRIAADIEMISIQEYAPEIMVEYRNCLHAARAITFVNARHAEIAEEMKRRGAQAAVKIQEAKIVSSVNAAAPPVVEEERTLTFRVTATVEKLRALKKFLEVGGYQYE